MLVYDACAVDVRHLVARFFRAPFEREDAIQEVWLLVHRVAASFDADRGDLRPWLRTVAANRCKELLRARGRRPQPDAVLDDDDLWAPETPETEVRQQRLRLAVDKFLATLSAEDALIFRLSIVEERTHDDVAASTGLSARRCKYLRMKLLARTLLAPELRQALQELLDP